MMQIDRERWRGVIGARVDPADAIRIEIPLAPSHAGGSGSFLAEGADRRRWYVKPQNNQQGGKVIVTEYLVGSLGRLIGAPVCEVAVVQIVPEIAGWEFRPGALLQSGLAHGSLEVPDASESRSLDHRDKDDNRRRHAGVYALYDWCWGGDDQWLYCWSDDHKLYSHDHGWYFPEIGADWTEAALTTRVDEPHALSHPAAGIDLDTVRSAAASLRSLGRCQLIGILGSVPRSWPVSDAELEALGFFLERRAPAVASRIEALAGV